MRQLTQYMALAVMAFCGCAACAQGTAGSVSVASVTASGSNAPDQGPANAVDGKTNTFWMSNGGGPSWIEFSLGSDKQVNGIWFDSGECSARYPIDYRVQTWNSASSSWVDQSVITGSKHWTSFHAFAMTTTNKVRFYITVSAQSDQAVRIQEFGIYNLSASETQQRDARYALARQIPSLITSLRQSPTGLTGTRTTLTQRGSLSVTHNTGYWFLVSAGTETAIDKSTGAIVNLKSQTPTALDVVPPTQNGLLTYVWNKDQAWFDVLNVLSQAQVVSGTEGGLDYVRISGKLDLADPSRRNLLDASLTYTLWADRMDVKVSLNYKQTDASMYEIAAIQAYTPSDWQYHVYPGSAWHLTMPTTDRNRWILGYADDKTNSYEFGVWHPELATYGGHGPNVSYPFGVLERSDRYFLWGYRDLGAFTIISPNNQGSLPSFLIAPSSLEAGKGYVFDFSYKFFPKSTYGYTEVVRWYAQNVYSSEPVSAGIVALPQSPAHKTIPEGNYGGYGTPWGTFSNKFPYAYLDNERVLLTLRMTNTHQAYWCKWDDTYPSSGSWYPWDNTLNSITAEAFKADIKRQQNKGIKCLLYFRQLLNTAGLHSDRAPYRAWTKKYKDGREFTYAGAPLATGIPQRIAQSEGIDLNTTYGWVYADFQNQEYRDFYIQQVKNCIDYYGLDGVFWDMGWMDAGMGYTASDQVGGSGIHHGILRVQYEIYNYLKSKNPQGFVITNCSLASPSAIWADAVMFEGGNVDQRTVEAQKAFNTEIINLSYSASYPGQPQEHIHTIMRALSYGTSWGGHGYEFFEHPDSRDPAYGRNLGLYLLPMTKFAAVSARTNSLPLVTDSKSITTNASTTTASVWASADDMAVVIYNDSLASASFRVEISQSRLAGYGVVGSPTLSRTLFGVNGLPVADVTGTTQTVSGGKIVLQGNLPGRNLLALVRRPIPEGSAVSKLGDLGNVSSGALVSLDNKVVTASFSGGREFYIEEADRTSAARVVGPGSTSQADRVNVAGILVSENGEKTINASSVVKTGTSNTLPAPLAVSQRGIQSAGPLLSGMLSRIWGRVNAVHTDGTLLGSYMMIDDGSGLQGVEPGLRVNAADVGGYPWFMPSVGTFVTATGVIGGTRDALGVRSCLRPRSPGDIQF